jgi:hypothetical protein
MCFNNISFWFIIFVIWRWIYLYTWPHMPAPDN